MPFICVKPVLEVKPGDIVNYGGSHERVDEVTLCDEGCHVILFFHADNEERSAAIPASFRLATVALTSADDARVTGAVDQMHAIFNSGTGERANVGNG